MKEDVWFTRDIRYGAALGYVMLQLPYDSPPPLTLNETEFEPKQELHCSLLSTRKLAAAFKNPEKATLAIADFVREYVKSKPIQFKGFTKHVYLCEEEEAKSIVIEAKVEGVTEFYAALRSKFKELAGLDDPALHVTLYKYNHQFGIGIHNKAQLLQLCRPISYAQLPVELREFLE